MVDTRTVMLTTPGGLVSLGGLSAGMWRRQEDLMVRPDSSDQRGLTRRDVLGRGAAAGLILGAGAAAPWEAVAATPKPKRGGTLRVGLIGGSPARDNLDPHLEGSSQLSQSYRQLVYSKLADQMPDGSYANQLAESMTPNKDATVWEIKLKKGIHFHDGSELTVDDVIYTFQRILDPANKLDAARGNITMIDPAGMK